MRFLLILIQAPGIITHEFSHALLCVLSSVKIYKIRLLRFRDPPGFVEHAEPEDFFSHLLIACGPFLGNSLLALLLAGRVTGSWWQGSHLIFFWLSFVIGLHALPSDGDSEGVIAAWSYQVRQNWLTIIFAPVLPLVFLLKLLKRLHGRFLYAALLVALGSWYLKIR